MGTEVLQPSRRPVDIHLPGGKVVTVLPEGGSRIREELLRPAYAELRFTRTDYVELPVGSIFRLDGATYTLYAPAAVTREGEFLFDYTARFESDAAAMAAIVALNPVDGRAAFPYTATPREHLDLIVHNMNARGERGAAAWRVAACVEGAPREIAYSATSCLAALAGLAETFGTEWRCVGRAIYLHRIGHGEADPVPLGYGPGQGLKPGVQRQVHEKDGNPIGRLFVQGGERNIDFATYRSKRLHMPPNAQIRFDGAHFEDETGFCEARAVTYITDADGASLRREGTRAGGVAYHEGSLALEDIYPRYVGRATGVDANGMDFYDKNIPADLDFNDARVPGEKATVIFQTGMLAGREVDIVQTETALTGYNHAQRKFQLVPLEEGGVSIPSKAFPVRENDRYAVFHVKLPPAYVRMAEGEMLRAAVRYLHPRAGHRFTVRAEVDGAWARGQWEALGGRLGLGGYVAIKDKALFGGDEDKTAVLRVVAVARRFDDPYSPQLELSNEPAAGGIFTQLARARAQEQIVSARAEQGVQYTRRSLRDAQDGMRQLAEAAKVIGGFEKSIKPATVATMGAVVGSDATNFRFETPEVFTWQAAGQQVKAHSLNEGGANIVVHASLELKSAERNIIKGAEKGKPLKTQKRWDVSKYTSGSITDSAPRFLYLACEKEGKHAYFTITKEAMPLEKQDVYYLLAALISGPDGFGNRSVQPTYGYTEITPGTLRTDKIVSADGLTYFDLENGEIGGRIRFKETEADVEAKSEQAEAQSNLIPNGCLGKRSAEGWRAIRREDNNEYAAINEPKYEGEKEPPYVMYNATITRGKNIPSYIHIGQVWGYDKMAKGADTYVNFAVHIKHCNAPNALRLEGYFGGNYDFLKKANDFRKDGKKGNINDETLALGGSKLVGSSGVFALTWILETKYIPFNHEGKFYLELSFYRVGAWYGKEFNGWDMLLPADDAYRFTAVDGGWLRTYGLLLMQGRGQRARTTAGLCGGGSNKNYSNFLPAFWAGGTFEEGVNAAHYLSALLDEKRDVLLERLAHFTMARIALCHNGAAKIGPLTLDKNGTMAWIDNLRMFQITPTEAMPSLERLLSKRPKDETKSLFKRDIRNFLFVSANQDTSERRVKEDSISLRESRYVVLPMVSPSSKVTVEVYIHIECEFSFYGKIKDGRVKTPTATIWTEGNLYIGKDYKVPLQFYQTEFLSKDKTIPFSYYTTQPITREAKAGDIIRLDASVNGRVEAQYLILEPPLQKETGDGEGFASAGINDLYISVTCIARYSSVEGQQLFIIARDGFALIHSNEKYIYCNASNTEFKAKGLTLE